MAVYTNLAVDCAANESSLACLHDIYSSLALTTSSFGVVGCDVEHIKPHRNWGRPDVFSEDAGDWHTLCVTPNGIGNGLPLTESLIDELRPQLYQPLKSGLSFRSAWFGWEAQDCLGEGTWLEVLREIGSADLAAEMPGLVLSEDLVKAPSAIESLESFCPGYMWYRPNSL